MIAPGLSSRRDYQQSWLWADVIAGVTVAAYLVPQAHPVPRLVVYRYDSPLFFANAEDFRRRALAADDSSPLLADYDVTSGRIWLLVPIWVAIGPTVVRRLRVNLSESPDLNHRT